MLYQAYKQKIVRLANVLAVIKRFRVLICAVICVILGATGAYLYVKGLVYDSVECPVSIVVGETLNYEGKAILGSVTYEYAVIKDSTDNALAAVSTEDDVTYISPVSVEQASVEDSSEDEWTTVMPNHAGKYKVRCVSRNVFGNVRYGAEHVFSILPKEITVTVSDSSVRYGDLPNVTAETVYGDVITCTKFTYEDPSKKQTSVTPDVDYVTIYDTNGKDVTSSYTLKVQSTEISFETRAITVTVSDKSIVYNGVALTFDGYELSSETPLAEGDKLIATFTDSRTDVGTSTNTPQLKVVSNSGLDVSGNYTFDINSGKLTVEKRKVIISTGSDSKVYDAENLICTDFVVDSSTPLANGQTATVTTYVQPLTVGEYANTLTFAFSDSEGNDVTDNYSLFVNEGTLTITKRNITLQCANTEWVYDGDKHEDKKLTVSEEQGLPLIDGQSINIISNSSIVNVGSVENVIEAAIYNGKEDVSSNYEITYINGMLTVTKRPISIVSSNAEWVYDGQSHISSDFYFADDSEYQLVKGQVGKPSATTEVTNVSEVENVLSVSIFANKEDVSDNYEISYAYGKLTVTKRPITVDVVDCEYVYDGTEHTSDDIDVAKGTLVSGHNISAITNGSQTVVGSCDNKIVEGSVSIRNGDGADKNDMTDNYAITIGNSGTITVTARPVTFTTATTSWNYDGEEHSDGNHDVSTDSEYGLVEGHNSVSFELAVITEIRNVDNAMTIEIYDGDEKVTTNYSIDYELGTLTINPRPVTVTMQSNSFVYDGKSHSHEYCDVAEKTEDSGLLSGHEVQLSECASIINKGQTSNTATVSIMSEGTEVTAYYEITFVEGTLEVTPRPITIKTATDTYLYDANDHSNTDYDILGGSLVEGQEIKIDTDSDTVPVTAVNHATTVSVENKFAIYIVDSDNTPVTDNYDIAYSYGTLTVNKLPIQITSDSDEKVYDAKPLTCLTFNYTVSNESNQLPTGHQISLTKWASITDVKIVDNIISTIDNVITAKICDQNETDLSSNYEITYVNGTLKVTPCPLTITADSDSKVYDGLPLTVLTFTYQYQNTTYNGTENIPTEHSITVKNDTSLTVVKTIDNVISSATIKDAEGVDITQNYSITLLNGALTVTERPITIETDYAEKIYDATALISNTIVLIDDTTIADKSIADKYSITASATGSQTDAGESENPITRDSVTIYDNNGDNVTGYYIVSYSDKGILCVKPRPITLLAGSDEKTYDGEPLICHSWEYSENSLYHLVDGQTIDSVQYNGSQTEAYTIQNDAVIKPGTSENAIEEVVIKSGTTDVTKNYEINKEVGKLTVYPRPIKIATTSTSWKYDGNEHYDTTYEVISELNFINAHRSEADVNTATKIKHDKQLSNEFVVKAYDIVTGEDKSLNYDIAYTYGTLNLTQRNVSIISNSHSWVYDGEEHYDTDFNLSSNSEDDFVSTDVMSVTEYTIVKEVGEHNNVIALKIVDSDEVDVTSFYALTIQYGQLEVTLRPIILKVNSCKEKTYDGLVYAESCDLVATDGSLVDGHLVSAILNFDFVKANTYNTTVTVSNITNLKIVDSKNNEYTSNYHITIESTPVTIIINQRAITIQAVDYTREYDGTEFCTQNADIGINLIDQSTFADASIASRYTITAKTNSTHKNAGEYYDNAIVRDTIIIRDNNGDIVTDCYSITCNDEGKFTITKRKITITSDDAKKVYDGTPLTCDTFKVTEGSLVAWHTCQVEIKGTITNVGTAPNTISKVTITDTDNSLVTDNYDIKNENGTLTVTARPLTITSDDAKKVYDGTPLTCNTFKVTQGSLVEWHTCQIETSGTITDFGKAPNTISKVTITDTLTNDDVTSNYEITLIAGTLIIQYKAVIHPYSITYVYDGKSHSYDDDDWYWEDQPDDVSVEINLSSLSLTDVDELGNQAFETLTVKISNANGEDITEMYEVSYEYAALADSYLAVVKRNITIYTKSATKVYDGEELTCEEYWLTGDLAEGDSILVTFTESIVDVGTKDNIANVIIYNKEGRIVTDNYNITSLYGTLEVEKQ